MGKIINYFLPWWTWVKSQALLISYVVVITTSIYGTHVYHVYLDKKEQDKQVTDLIATQKIDRQTIKDLNLGFGLTMDYYNKLGAKKNATKLISGKCTLTADAIRLWNESLFGKEYVPPSTSGAFDLGGASISELYDNEFRNSEIIQRNKERHKKLEAWYDEVYGK